MPLTVKSPPINSRNFPRLLLERREELARALGERSISQYRVADLVGISMPSYQMAETYGVIRGKVGRLLQVWLDRPLTEIVAEVRRERGRK